MSKIETFILEADKHEQLVLAIRILQHWHRSVSHFITGIDTKGVPYLSLLWTDPGGTTKATPLLAPMHDADAIALQVQSWLKTINYGREPNHDGSNTKGFRVTNKGPDAYNVDAPAWMICPWSFYTFLTVKPFWNEYHK